MIKDFKVNMDTRVISKSKFDKIGLGVQNDNEADVLRFSFEQEFLGQATLLTDIKDINNENIGIPMNYNEKDKTYDLVLTKEMLTNENITFQLQVVNESMVWNSRKATLPIFKSLKVGEGTLPSTIELWLTNANKELYKIIESEKIRESNETIRINQEQERNSNEKVRVVKENERSSSESSRQSGEESRKNAEVLRENNEQKRILNENERIANEDIRLSFEKERIANESKRSEDETRRLANEKDRNIEEQKRINSESNRAINEEQRKESENTRISSEIERASSEAQRVNQETNRIREENLRNSNEVSRLNNETLRIKEENVRKLNETNRITLENQRNEYYEKFKEDVESGKYKGDCNFATFEVVDGKLIMRKTEDMLIDFKLEGNRLKVII